MKRIKISVLSVATLSLAVAGLFNACTPEPSYYSQVTPENFFDSKTKVYQRAARAYGHWIWSVGGSRSPLVLFQDFTADAMNFPTRYADWADGGRFVRYHTHDFTPLTEDLGTAWRAVTMGIAQAWSAKEDIDNFVDFDALGFTEQEASAISYELQALAGFFYLNGLDLWGGMPLYENNQGDAVAKSTPQETFDFIERLLTESLPNLSKRTTGQALTGNPQQGAAAMMLMRLYFNSEAYTGVARFDKAAEYAQKIIDGEYGAYALEDTWTDIFGYENHLSPEVIWAAPAQNALQQTGIGPQSSPYDMNNYWGIFSGVGGRDNGFCLLPGLDVNGKSYLHPESIYGNTDPSPKGTFRLGSAFAKFHDTDVRKQLYFYGPEKGKWGGMFLMGDLINPVTGARCNFLGRSVMPNGVLVTLVDQVGRLTPRYPEKNPDGTVDMTKPVYDDDYMKEGLVWADEGSGMRLTKHSPIPNEADRDLLGNPDYIVMRLAEAYYTLAECKLRAGDKAGAASLINDVRKRYFTGTDPQAATAETMDEWRMLDEWLVEFLGEGRRRTDLVRWDKYTTEKWWDHEPSAPHKNLMPFPAEALAGNHLLEQNPGYN